MAWQHRALGLCVLFGCSASPEVTARTPLPLRQGTFLHTVEVRGDVLPVLSEGLVVPDRLWGTLEFLTPEGSQVKKGQVIAKVNARNLSVNYARFAERMALEQVEQRKQRAQLPLDRMAIDMELAEKRRTLQTTRLSQQETEKGPRRDERVKAQVDVEVPAMKRAAYPLAEKRLLASKGYLSAQELAQAELEYARLERETRKAELSREQLGAAYRAPTLQQAELETERARLDVEVSRIEGEARKTNLGLRTRNSGTRSQRFQRRFENYARLASQSDLKAPVSGVVTYPTLFGDTKPYVGMEVWQGLTVLNVSDISKLKVLTRVSELDILFVKPGLPVEIRSPSLPDKVFTGKVETVHKLAKFWDENVPKGLKYFDVDIVLPTTPPELKTQSTVEVKIQAASTPNSWYVPLEALAEEDGKTWLYLVRAGKTERTAVEVTARSHDFAVLKGAYQPGDAFYLPTGGKRE
jgi:multidrug resistance efflux pump